MRDLVRSRRQAGITLIEIMIVIAIMGILSGIVVNRVEHSLAKARDVRRKSDLKRLELALESYRVRNSSYPSTNAFGYSSEPDNLPYDNNNGNWIPGLAPTFIPSLPRDPVGGETENTTECAPGQKRAYIYLSDSNGYKLMSMCNQETSWDSTDPFYDPAHPLHAWMVCSGEGCSWT